MSDASTMTRDQVGAAIAREAWKDEAFHKAVLAAPSKVFEEPFGRPLPAGLTIKALEDTPTTVHFVIPARPATAGELSDDELEAVAGGVSPAIVTASIAASLSGAVAPGNIPYGRW